MEQNADAIIRGLRELTDFEFEFNMALMNRHLQPSIETIFVMPNEQFSYTSSSLVKQVARYGGQVAKFVPPNVAEALQGGVFEVTQAAHGSRRRCALLLILGVGLATWRRVRRRSSDAVALFKQRKYAEARALLEPLADGTHPDASACYYLGHDP